MGPIDRRPPVRLCRVHEVATLIARKVVETVLTGESEAKPPDLFPQRRSQRRPHARSLYRDEGGLYGPGDRHARLASLERWWVF